MYYLKKHLFGIVLQRLLLVLVYGVSTFTVYAQSTSLQTFKGTNKLWGLKNASGKIVKSPQYQIIFTKNPFKKGLLIVKKDDLLGIINARGKYVIEPSLNKIDIFTQGKLFRVLKDQLWGIINAKGKFIFKPQFSQLTPMKEGGFKPQKNNLWGYINTKGKQVISPSLQQIKPFKEGLALVQKEGLWGYINLKGKYVVQPKFLLLGSFAEGLAWAAEKYSDLGYINTKGKYVISPQFQDASPFHRGHAVVLLNNKVGMINKSGKVTVPCQYRNIEFLTPEGNSDFAIVSKEKLHGLVDIIGLVNYITGQQIIPCEYFSIEVHTIKQQQFIIVKDRQEKYSLLDIQGKKVFGSYDAMEYHNSEDGILVQKGMKKFFVDTAGKYLRDFNRNKDQEEKIFMIVEERSQPRGGMRKFHEFVKKNMIYPEEAKKQQIEGRVFLQFLTDKDGNLSDIRVLKGLGHGCDKEAIRLLKATSPWTPRGRSSKKTRHSLPIMFRLPGD